MERIERIHRDQMELLFHRTQKAARIEALEWSLDVFGEGDWWHLMRTEILRLKGEK